MTWSSAARGSSTLWPRPPIQSESGFSWSNWYEASAVSMENQSRFLRPGEIWLITLEPIAPWSVTNCMTAASSVPDPEAPGRGSANSWALTRAMRWPVTNSTRSHQWTPMSPNARDWPPRAGSTRQFVSSGRDSQSCR